MFFGAPDDDDDDDFTPSSSSSKLSALFGGSSSGKSSSLKYVAPKQPRPDLADSTGRGGNNTPSTGEHAASGNKQPSAVLAAVPVHAFLYVNQSGQPQGRAMCCILGESSETNFQLLLYRSKQDHLTRAKITQHFSVTVQANYYANFIDDQQRNWSILLEPSNYAGFLTQIGICRALVGGGTDSGVVSVQDIGFGEGPVLKEGDQAQLSVTIWQVNSDGKKGEEVEERKVDLRVKLKDLDGNWKVGLIGAQKNTHRLIFTHTSKTSGSRMVAHEVTVSRVRQKGGHDGGGGELSGRSTPQVHQTPPPLQEKVVNSSDMSAPESQAEEVDVGPQSQSIPSSKAHLVSRVAKLGHQIFPVNPASHIQPTDSESEVEEITRKPGRGKTPSEGSVEELEVTPAVPRHASSRPTPSPRPHSIHQPQQMVVYQPAFHPHHTAMAGGYGPGIVTAPHSATPAAPPAPDPTLNLLFSETRTQNTELKISVARMSDKIDTLVTKIDKLEQQHQQQQVAVAGQTGMGIGGMGGMMMMPQYPIPTPALPTATQADPQALLAQVTSVVRENETMRVKLEEKEAKVVALNESLTQLLHKNQKLLEEKTSMLEAQGVGGGIGGEVAMLKEEKAKLTGQLSLTSHQLDTLREELSLSKERQHDKEKEVEELRKQVTVHESSSQDNHMAKESLLNQINQLQERVDTAQRESEMSKKERDEAFREREKAKNECEVAQQDKENARRETEAMRKECEAVKHEKEVALREVSEARENLNERAAQDTARQQHETTVAQEQVQNLEVEKRQLEERIKMLEAATQKGSSNSNEDTVAVVKRIMNHVYRTIKPQFLPTQAYQGDVVLQNLLTVIKNTTLSLMEEMDTTIAEGKKDTKVAGDKEKVNGGGETEKGGNKDNQIIEKPVEVSGEVSVLNEIEESQSKDKASEVSSSSSDMEDLQRIQSPPRDANPNQNSNINFVSHDNNDFRMENTDSTDMTSDNISNVEPVKSTENTSELVKNEDINAIQSSTEIPSMESNTSEKESVNSSHKDPIESESIINSLTNEKMTREKSGSRDSSSEREWRPQPPTPPLFSDEDDDDNDWLS